MATATRGMLHLMLWENTGFTEDSKAKVHTNTFWEFPEIWRRKCTNLGSEAKRTENSFEVRQDICQSYSLWYLQSRAPHLLDTSLAENGSKVLTLWNQVCPLPFKSRECAPNVELPSPGWCGTVQFTKITGRIFYILGSFEVLNWWSGRRQQSF